MTDRFSMSGSSYLVSDPGDIALVTLRSTNQESLLYPFHGRARGGVGTLLATGARGGTGALPRSLSANRPDRPATGSSCTRSLHSLASTHVSTVSSKEWEKGVPHPTDFLRFSRSARTYDVPPASRWAGISYYENSPAEIQRHLDIIHAVDQAHVGNKLEERQIERARHQSWAGQQRNTFRRQRAEQAAKYMTAGVPVRAPYVEELTFSKSWDMDSSVRSSSPGPPRSLSPFTPGTGTLSGFGSFSTKSDIGPAWKWSLRPPTAMASLTVPRTPPIPRATYNKVYRKEEEEDLSVAATVMQKMAERRQEAVQEELLTATRDVAELDDFEGHLKSLARRRSYENKPDLADMEMNA